MPALRFFNVHPVGGSVPSAWRTGVSDFIPVLMQYALRFEGRGDDIQVVDTCPPTHGVSVLVPPQLW